MAGQIVTLQDITNQLLIDVKKEKEENGVISDHLMSALHSVFQQPLLGALDLIDQDSVTRISCPAGRSLYLIRGTSGTGYYCFRSSNYCNCPSFIFTVLKKEDTIYCKHMVAVLVGEALGRVNEKQISDVEFSKLLSQMFEDSSQQHLHL